MTDLDEDLFAGMEVNGKIIGDARPVEQQKKIAPIDQDLFEGMEVNGELIGKPQVEGPSLTTIQPEELQAEEQQAISIDQRRELFRAQSQPQRTGFELLRFANQPPLSPQEVQQFTAESQSAKQSLGAGVSEAVTGAKRTTTDIEDLPEIGALSTGRVLDDLKVSAGLLLNAKPSAQMQIIKNAAPEAEFFRDQAGNIIVDLGEGKRGVLNAPGASPQDFLQGIATVLQYIPAARISAAAKSLAGKFGAGAATSAATEKVRQEGAAALGGESARDAGEIVDAALFGGAGEVAVPAVQTIRQARLAGQAGVSRAEVPQVTEAVTTAETAAEGLESAAGVRTPLFPAQQTLVPSELIKQRLLPQLDASSKVAFDALERQSKSVSEATAAVINLVADPAALETGARRLRATAQAAIDAKIQRRAIGTEKLYKKALKAGADVDLAPVKALVEKNLVRGEFTEKLKKSMTKIGRSIGMEEPTGRKPTLSQLQEAKFELDNMLEDVGPNALSTTNKRRVLGIQKELVEQMERASPAYKKANAEFIRLSPAVTELEESLIGQLARVQDPQLKNLSGKIFDPQQANPTVVRNAKKVIEEFDPEAWNEITRVELQKRFGGLDEFLTASDGVGNLAGDVPGQIRRAIFGGPQSEKRRTLFAALNPEQTKNFQYLDEVLRRASAGRAAGSPTTPFKEVLDKLKGIPRIIFEPLATVKDAGAGGLFDRRVRAAATAAFDDQYITQMKQIRKLNMNSPAAAKAFVQLLNDVEDDEEKETSK